MIDVLDKVCSPIPSALFERLGAWLLAEMDCSDSEVSLVLIDDAEMRPLNAQWRNIDQPTDVLAFAQSDSFSAQSQVLGDVLISVETATRQAAERGHSLERELTVLFVHGVLHLLGYDHIDDDEAEEMEALERTLLAKLP
jgi:probable rRNA maturation factor